MCPMRTASRCPSRALSPPCVRDSSVFTPRISSEPMSETRGPPRLRPRHGACRRLHQRLRGGPGRRHLGSGSLGQTKLEPPALVSAPCRPLISHDSKPKGSCIEMQLNPMLRRFACTSGGATCCTGMAAMYLAWTWRVLGVLLTRGWRAPGVWRTRIRLISGNRRSRSGCQGRATVIARCLPRRD